MGMTAVAGLLACLGLYRVASRKYGAGDSSRLLSVVGRVSLSPKQSIVVVKAGP
jgi:flagellar biogenesis protein FliO